MRPLNHIAMLANGARACVLPRAESFSDSIGAIDLGLVERLFDHVSDVFFYVKDNRLRFTHANAAMLELFAFERVPIKGRTARELSSRQSCAQHEQAERSVLASKKPIKDQLTPWKPVPARTIWTVSSTWPLIDHNGLVCGVAVVAKRLAAEKRCASYERLAVVAERLAENYCGAVDLTELAREVGLSLSALNRGFTAVFGVTPAKYLTQLRLEHAVELIQSGWPIADVAQACGYSDQSAFTRRFRIKIGIAPIKFRRSGAPYA